MMPAMTFAQRLMLCGSTRARSTMATDVSIRIANVITALIGMANVVSCAPRMKKSVKTSPYRYVRTAKIHRLESIARGSTGLDLLAVVFIVFSLGLRNG